MGPTKWTSIWTSEHVCGQVVFSMSLIRRTSGNFGLFRPLSDASRYHRRLLFRAVSNRSLWEHFGSFCMEEVSIDVTNVFKRTLILSSFYSELQSIGTANYFCDNGFIFKIIYTTVNVRKVQVAILARLPREMSQTDRILPRYILSRVRVSFRPRILLYVKKPQSRVARPAAVDHSSAADKQLNWNRHNPFS